MTRQELEAIWLPRIGPAATAELRRYRQAGFIGMGLPFVAGAAGLLIGTSTLGDVLGAALAAVVAWRLAAFIRAQVRIAAALSEWYGVKIRGIPVMNPKRFDEWRQARDLHHPGEQIGGGQETRASEVEPGHSR
jgi:hypothetical protein